MRLWWSGLATPPCVQHLRRASGARRSSYSSVRPSDEAGETRASPREAIRFAYDGLEDLRALMPDLSEDEIARTDFGTYTENQFFDDMARVTENRADPDLVELLVRRSKSTLMWLRSKGFRFVPIYGRQAFKVNNRFKFWGGLTVEAWGGGPGLVEATRKRPQSARIPLSTTLAHCLARH